MRRFLHTVINLGVTPDTDPDEIKKTRILNIIFLISTPVTVIYLIRNFIDGFYPLAIANIAVVIRNLLFLYFNYKNKIYHARIAMSVIGMAIISSGAILFQNGLEFFLIVHMILVAFLLPKRIGFALLVPLNGIIFIGIRIYNEYNSAVYPVPNDRNYANLILSIVLLGTVIIFYMKEQIKQLKRLHHANSVLVEQKKELENTKEQLVVLNTAKEKLFSIVAHDMRSPISNLRQALALTSQKMLSKEEFESVSAALLVQVDQLQDNMMNLLHWSKAQLTGIQTVPVAVNIQQCVEDILQLFNSNLNNKKLQVQLNCDAELFFFADPEHVKVVLRNVINNAIKFSYVGGAININAIDDNEKICIYIKDQGIGITTEKLNSLFKFEEANSSFGTLNEKGTGLGLILCKEFIEKNNGNISVSSEVGKGTQFKLCLPKATKKIPARKLTGITIEDI